MEAILIAENNFEKIASSTPYVTEYNIGIMKEFLDPESPAYFIVEKDDRGAMTIHNWATYPGGSFTRTYDFDPEKIKTEFVPLTVK